MKKIILPLLLIVVALAATAQPYYFRHYQVELGLSNNAVVCSALDARGFLWFGTKDGLNRFDGYSFKVFRHDAENPNGIGNNFIHSLYTDKNQVMWVGTDHGLYRYNEIDESFSLMPTPFQAPVTDIEMDEDGQLWFISNFNLFRYDPITQKGVQFSTIEYFESTSLCTLDDGSVWVATSNGLLKRYNKATNDFKSFDLFAHSVKSVSNWIEKLYVTSDDNILVGTSTQGVKLFNTSTFTYEDVLTYHTDGTEIFARDFLQTSRDECWIATESGIYIYNISTKKHNNLRKEYNNPYSISDNAVYTFCRDRSGGIWAGTYFGGLNYFSRQEIIFHKYFPEKGKNSISGNVVREIIEDRYGNLWIGTEDAGLNKLDRNSGLFTNYMPTGSTKNISYTNIHGLLAQDEKLWIGTFEHGLDVMDIRTGKILKHYSKGNDSNDLRSNFIYCIYQSKQNEVMIGTTIGAYLYQPSTDDFSLLPGMPLHVWYTSIVKDSRGVVWTGTYGNGIYYYDTKTGESGNYRYDAQVKNSLSHDRVTGIFEDSRQNLWFATEGGLCLYSKSTRTFTRYTTANGLPANFIVSLAEDKNGKMWIGTTKGLVCFDAIKKNINVYTRANGLLNDQFNFSSAFRDSRGNMYFGSVKGLTVFDPGEFQPKSFSPPIYITGFQLDNKELTINEGSPLKKSITLTEEITLTHHQSTFSIDFASLGYDAPEMSEYAYKMEGLYADWIYLKTNRKVYFTDLSPGTYTFRVRRANDNGTLDLPEAVLTIQILPPWWLSNWAFLLYAVLGILMIYYFIRKYHESVRKKNRRKMEEMELLKEKELYEAKMNFFTNVAHEIKTPLTLIKGPLENVIKRSGSLPEIKDSLRIMEKNTGRLVDLANQFLDFRQTEIKGFSLSFTEANINEIAEDIFTGFQPLAEQKNLSYSLSLPSKNVIACIDTEAFNKIVANLLSNAVKYARAKVVLSLLAPRPFDKSFTIEVKNDGYLIPLPMREKIFEPFFRLKETEKQKGTGIGLALSLSLTELHKGSLVLRKPEDDMNVFTVTIPFYQEHQVNLMQTT